MELRLVGQGNTANVYEWEDGKVVKLFHQGYPQSSIRKEFENATFIKEMGFPKPKAYEILDIAGQSGIIYDKIEGISALEWLMSSNDIEGCAKLLVRLQQRINANTAKKLPEYKALLRDSINRYLAFQERTIQEKNKAQAMLMLLTQLKDGETLCHGDYHPGNVFIHQQDATVIDFMNCCKGPREYDIARSLFLIQYSELPEGIPNAEELLKMRAKLADCYLSYHKVSREELRDYLSVICFSRAFE